MFEIFLANSTMECVGKWEILEMTEMKHNAEAIEERAIV